MIQPNKIIVSKGDENSNFVESFLDGSDVPVNSSGANFIAVQVSGNNVQSVFSGVCDQLALRATTASVEAVISGYQAADYSLSGILKGEWRADDYSLSGILKSEWRADDYSLSGILKSEWRADDATLSGILKNEWKADDYALSGILKSEWRNDDAVLSGILKVEWRQDDSTLSGILKNEWRSDIATYSGYAESAFVNISGDSMTGDLVMSGTNVLPLSSGIGTIGASGTPFSAVYADNFYDDGNSPTLSGQLANKAYVDSKGAVISGTLARCVSVDFCYASSNVPYVYSQSATPEIVAYFYFIGTELFGPVGYCTGVGNVASVGASGVALVRNNATSAVLFSGVFGNTANNVFNLVVLSGNVPAPETLCHVALYRNVGTGRVQLNSLHIRREYW